MAEYGFPQCPPMDDELRALLVEPVAPRVRMRGRDESVSHGEILLWCAGKPKPPVGGWGPHPDWTSASHEQLYPADFAVPASVGPAPGSLAPVRGVDRGGGRP